MSKTINKNNIWEVIQIIINMSFDILLNIMLWCLNAIMTLSPPYLSRNLGTLVQYCHLLLLICHNIYLLNPSRFFIPWIVLTTPRNSRISVRSQNAVDQQEGGLLSPTAAAVGDSSRSIKLSFNSYHSPRRLLIPQLPSEKWKQRRYEHPGCYS